MAIRVLDDGTIEAEGVSGGGPVSFTPDQAAFFGFGQEPVGLDPLVPATPALTDEEAILGAVDLRGGPQIDAGLPGVAPEPTFEDETGAALVEQGGQFVAPAPVAAPVAAEPQAPVPGSGVGLNEAVIRARGMTGDPTLDALIGRGLSEQEAALDIKDRALDERQAQLDELAEQRQALEVQRAREAQAQEADLRATYQDAERKTAEVEQEIEAAVKQEPDQGRWWASRSSMQKAAAYLGAAIQGYLNPGQPNTFVAALMDQVDKDVALQARQLEQQLDVLREKKAGVGIQLDRDVDLLRGVYGLKLSRLSSLEKMLDTADLAGANQLATAKMRSDILKEKGQIKQQTALGITAQEQQRKAAEEQAKTARAQRANIYSTIEDRRLRREADQAHKEALLEAQRNKNKAEAGEKKRTAIPNVLDENGRPIPTTDPRVQAFSPDEAEAIRDMQKDAGTAAGIIQALVEGADDERIWDPTDPEKAVAQNLAMQLRTAMRRTLAGPGVTSDADQAMINEIIPEINKVFKATTPEARKATLLLLLDRVDGELQSALQAQEIPGRVELKAINTQRYKARLKAFDDEAPDPGVRFGEVETRSDDDLLESVMQRYAQQGVIPTVEQINEGLAEERRAARFAEAAQSARGVKEVDPAAEKAKQARATEEAALTDLVEELANLGEGEALTASQMATLIELLDKRDRAGLSLPPGTDVILKAAREKN